jgi:hypothetical protein
MEQKSPAFSSFRILMDTWDTYLEEEEKENRVRSLLDGQGLIIFFSRGDSIFGAPEESRLTFARMKNPSEDDTNLDDATFIALNLLDTLMGKPQQTMFKMQDISKLKILPKEKCEKILLKHVKKPKEPSAKIKKLGKEQGDEDGLIKIDDEEE